VSNVIAFERLETAVQEHGQPFTRSDIFEPTSLGDPNEVVAYGLERTINTGTRLEGLETNGILSVKALVAVEGVLDPFEAERRFNCQGAARWLLRSRLTFEVPQNRHEIQEGKHRSTALYLLAPEDPAAIDAYYIEASARATSAEDETEVEVPPRSLVESSGPGILHKAYTQDLPGTPSASADDAPNAPRNILLADWLKNGPSADGAAMLRTTNSGNIGKDELPRTIGWLLKLS
jgi:hypothetical protein